MKNAGYAGVFPVAAACSDQYFGTLLSTFSDQASMPPVMLNTLVKPSAKLGSKHPRDVRHFDRMLQYILAVARTEVESPEERRKLRVEAMLN